MSQMFLKMKKLLRHLEVLHETFIDEDMVDESYQLDFDLYRNNLSKFETILESEDFLSELYAQKNRQMMLADFFEYIFLGRMYYAARKTPEKEKFFRAILHFVNMLMCYEAMTVVDELRRRFVTNLGDSIQTFSSEELFDELMNFEGKVGLAEGKSDASKQLDKYFDSILPKTAGGLWHELLVYIFMIRNDYGYVVPLLLTQRLIGLNDHIVPPDYLIITKDKKIFGVEVGTKKEIQSGSFSIRTGIPTATIDTINSRSSDRCPICQKWILFCPYVIDHFCDLSYEIPKTEVRCLEECSIYTPAQISAGECPYTKYKRQQVNAVYTRHKYANNYHYHYQCVLKAVGKNKRRQIIDAQDTTALKTHYPYYGGLEYLNK